MRRWVAGILTAGLIVSSIDGTVFAKGQEPVAVSAPVTLAEGTDTVSGTGVVEVQITAGTPVQSDQKFSVTLEGAREGVKEAVLPVRAEEANTAPRTLVRFSELEPGSYVLCVSGDGYLTYRQTISVEKAGYRVQL
ncbi:MAG: hypothetical protein NC341_13640, partial [Blautia sp.]|nr:hypothetical protein [Blautia sp.]